MFEDAAVISAYSRAQALEDGVLHDLGAVAPGECQAFYKHPVACTDAVWMLVARAGEMPGCSVQAVVHDVLFMSRRGSRSLNRSTVEFQVILAGSQQQAGQEWPDCDTCTLILTVGPGDDLAPVITICFPGES